MVFEDIQFPLYRKYKNNKHFFKITSAKEFEEIQIIGSKRIVRTIHAKILPEMNQVYDLVYNFEKFGGEISEKEYLEQLEATKS
jgi:hypothetical protein